MGNNIPFGAPSSCLTLVHIFEYSFLTDYMSALIKKMLQKKKVLRKVAMESAILASYQEEGPYETQRAR